MKETASPISRIIFNFTNKCNLPCKFCYVPFNTQDNRDLLLWQKIVARCKDWNPKIITFGGGDPFMYKDFPSLLENTRDGKIFIQVDTNALAMREDHVPAIKKSVQLISLPLDGNEDIHTEMRGNPSHFRIVLKWLARLSEENIPIKINTVVTKVNINNLADIAKLIERYPIHKWTLYQFWPLSRGKVYRNIFEVSPDDFTSATSQIQKYFGHLNIESSPISVRLYSYFFVSHTGRVYVMDRDNHEEYAELGSIFEADILQKWERYGNYEKLMKRAELRTSL